MENAACYDATEETHLLADSAHGITQNNESTTEENKPLQKKNRAGLILPIKNGYSEILDNNKLHNGKESGTTQSVSRHPRVVSRIRSVTDTHGIVRENVSQNRRWSNADRRTSNHLEHGYDDMSRNETHSNMSRHEDATNNNAQEVSRNHDLPNNDDCDSTSNRFRTNTDGSFYTHSEAEECEESDFSVYMSTDTIALRQRRHTNGLSFSGLIRPRRRHHRRQSRAATCVTDSFVDECVCCNCTIL
ncbi:uncharacterized protein LOC110231925 [Exaiptasia diaphana]|uniref:Uncharacterized protein n=1 Tax=Exaiptasia diaphana TaxID=2652724 RepID=A0A913WQP8_EXADI|nr:uncharacterized protein LOC110231925 [Exaiptasia diaphana]